MQFQFHKNIKICYCVTRTAKYFSGKKHSVFVVAGQQNILLVRNILSLW